MGVGQDGSTMRCLRDRLVCRGDELIYTSRPSATVKFPRLENFGVNACGVGVVNHCHPSHSHFGGIPCFDE